MPFPESKLKNRAKGRNLVGEFCLSNATIIASDFTAWLGMPSDNTQARLLSDHYSKNNQILF